jgi:hypothetical protein
MKKNVLIFFLILLTAIARGQVIINPQLPPFGLVLKSQLWSLAVVNTANSSLTVQVQMLVTDESNNQKVFSGTSRDVTISKGLTEITANDAAPVTYNILSNGYNLDTSPDGFLPLGIFSVCYTVTLIMPEGNQTLTEQCEDVEVMPLSPPSLVSPLDSETLQQFTPVFTWLPPQPYNLFTGLTYYFTLVAVQPTQSGADAIQQNVPIETQENLSVGDLLYNNSFPALDTGILYAWQITAVNNGTPVSKSEVWTFRIKQFSTDTATLLKKNYFARMKRTIDASYSVCEGVLKYAYHNEINDTLLNFNIYDLSTASRKQLQLDSTYLKAGYGENYNTIDFTQTNLLTAKHMYLLEIINSRNEHWYLKFQYIQSN